MNTAEPNTDKLIADLKRIVQESEELLHATKGAAGEEAHEVRKRLNDTLESVRRTCHRLEDKAVQGARVADKTIREHPYESIGVAFGVGLLIGALVTRK